MVPSRNKNMMHYKKVIKQNLKETIECMELYSDYICDLQILKDESQVGVIEGILQNYCDVKLDAILVHPDFKPIIEKTNDVNHIPKFKLEMALSNIDAQAFSYSETIEKIMQYQKPLKAICKLIKEGFLNSEQTLAFFPKFFPKVDTTLSIMFAAQITKIIPISLLEDSENERSLTVLNLI